MVRLKNKIKDLFVSFYLDPQSVFYLDRNNFPDLLDTEALFPNQFLSDCQIWKIVTKNRVHISKYGKSMSSRYHSITTMLLCIEQQVTGYL